MSEHKILPIHLERKALVYVRQSSEKQVRENLESQRLQYGLEGRARSLGWREVEIIDRDLGVSGAIGRREGFERVLASVAMGQVGGIFCTEVSRLSRNDPDWARLVQVCGLFGTLILDEDGIYDLSLSDDQLILGIKGTLSVLEHSHIRRRMQQAQREKASRGELRRRLPVGYLHDLEGRIVKDPDLRIQSAVELVFSKFREIWSIRQTFRWFQDEGLELPNYSDFEGRRRLTWSAATQGRVGAILRNPLYAGAYAYGRRQQRLAMHDGRPVKRDTGYLPQKDWHVLLYDHHEAYISWEVHEDNLNKIRGNSLKTESDAKVGAVRVGQGLFAGLMRCGHCGRKLSVRYWGKSGTAARYLCKGDFDAGGSHCLGFGGATVDRRLGQSVLDVLSPMGLAACLEAAQCKSQEGGEHRRALEMQLQQAEYEARRAFEQYNEVDPRNRLVATELENRWNQRLEEVARAQTELEKVSRELLGLNEQQRTRILALGGRFEHIWNSPQCPPSLKKKILRTLLEEIAVNLDEPTQQLRFVLHWKGGAHTQFTMDKPRSGVGLKTPREDLEIIGQLAGFYGDDEIARVLNKLGRKTAKGNRWSSDRVTTIRRRYEVALRTDGDQRGKTILSQPQAAEYCSVSTTVIRKLVERGYLSSGQRVPWAPWEIDIRHLDSEPVLSALKELRSTGRVPNRQREDLECQGTLFQEMAEELPEVLYR